ncbi:MULTISPECIES: 3-keto-5-aminohexanoate cleavage protein [Mesorhizobium]|uniref:3-keto-5-aminohexanoate cleavage protein n=1 Tax=Mesorhizobium TaxID=68287 RepID=UPI0011B3E4DF|nr:MULTISPECIES: 3-keto-5-aminohexanoate cleavage protein [Mesorhizobium]QKD15649.1 3-keto-5-aminohexanoate cleavage protein [Mesorhizobium sp. NZP2077]
MVDIKQMTMKSVVGVRRFSSSGTVARPCPARRLQDHGVREQNKLLQDAIRTGPRIGRAALSMSTQTYPLGGHVRVGKEGAIRAALGLSVDCDASLRKQARRLPATVQIQSSIAFRTERP